jgi:NADH-quinone oxidoreductase subunit C
MLDISILKDKVGQDFCERLKQSEDGQAIYVLKEDVLELLRVLKNNFGFVMLADITAVECEDKLEVVYHLMALNDAQALMIKVDASKDSPVVPSIIPVWKAANVLEREIYDLMGIHFEGHDELKRILCPEDFKGHPLRKSFKLDISDRFN